MAYLAVYDGASQVKTVISFSVSSTVRDETKEPIYTSNWTPMFYYIARINTLTAPQIPPFRIDWAGMEIYFYQDSEGPYITYCAASPFLT